MSIYGCECILFHYETTFNSQVFSPPFSIQKSIEQSYAMDAGFNPTRLV